VHHGPVFRQLADQLCSRLSVCTVAMSLVQHLQKHCSMTASAERIAVGSKVKYALRVLCHHRYSMLSRQQGNLVVQCR